VRIQHNGMGMTTEEQQLLFEPFFASSHATADSEDQSSAGERLSFAQFIIAEQHQGKIAVTSDINIGTTFHIQLPYPTAADAEDKIES
jgi:signal transduction histidine kinase